MKDKKRVFVPVLGNFVLAALSLTLALGLVEVLMRAFPTLVPAEVRVNPPARRVKAFIDQTYDLKQSDGDLFHYMRGSIAPLSPEQDQIVAHVHMVTDANGFRNSPPEKDTYSMVALGDSFTRASGVASPWPQRLAQYAGQDVLNLGEVGFGPQEELEVLQQYGLKKQPRWVIVAYFGGNDLYDAASYEQATPFILLRFGRYMLDQSMEAWQERQDKTQTETVSNNRYPIEVTTDHEDLEMIFFSYYISWLSVNQEMIKASQNYRLVRETIVQMRDVAQAQDAHLLMVYVPSKEHVYLPYLQDADILKRVFSDIPALTLDEAGYLQFTGKRTTAELTYQYMDDQPSLLADFASEQNIPYLDLTPAFQEQAGKGAELYYLYDTHWNQAGHDLAAQAIFEYMQGMPTDTANMTSGN